MWEMDQLAERGDVDGMLSLGSISFAERDIPQALYWFALAAEQGSPEGIYAAAGCHMLLALEQVDRPEAEREAHWRQAHRWYTQLLDYVGKGWDGTEEIWEEIVRQKDRCARYHLACCEWQRGACDGALLLLGEMRDKRSRILRALLEQSETGPLDAERLSRWKSLAEDREYARRPKLPMEDMAYTAFLAGIEGLRRSGGAPAVDMPGQDGE